MANTTIKITQLPSIGNGLSASTILPVVNTTGTAITAKVAVGNVANFILTQAGNTLEPAFLSTIAYSVANAAQPNITSVGTLSVGTLKITGGDNGQYLQTDGAGNLSWVAGGGSGNGEVGGANSQLQFNNAGNFDGNPGLTWDASNNQLNTVNFAASSATIYGNVNAINVNASGNIRPNAIYTDHYYYANGYVFGGSGNGTPGGSTTQVQFNNNGAFAGQGNFTYDAGNNILNVIRANVSYLTAYTSITGGNSVTANYFIGSGANLTNIAGANVSGFVPNANVANTAFAVAAANVIGLGNIATISLSGSSSNVLYGNGVFAPASGGGNANTGNVTFDNINIIGTGNLNLQPDPANSGSYLDIFLTSGPDLHLVASANANLILGKDNDANVLVSWDGNVYVQSWSSNTGNVGGIWTFDSDGNLTLPNDANIAIYGNTTQFNTCPNGFLGLNSYDAGGNNIARVGISSADKLVGIGVSDPITELDYNWTFTNGGGTIFPTLTVDLHNGGNQTAQTLQFGDDTQQAVITGPTPSANINAQRLIIQGQRGNGQFSEGGDVYLWAGDADTNGGDIKIYAGDSDGATGSGGYINLAGGDGADNAGYVNIDGGYSSNGYGGYVNITGGSSGSGIGGNIQIQAGQSGGGNINGANILLQGGYSQSANGGAVTVRGGQSAIGLPGYGNVLVEAGSSQWVFDNTGTLTVPQNIHGSGALQLQGLANGNTTINIGSGVGGDIDMVSNLGNINLYTASNQPWIFDQGGNLTAPGAIKVGNMSIGTVPGDITANNNTTVAFNVTGSDGGFLVNYLDEVGNANTSGGELAFNSELGNATYRISLSDDLGDGFATKIWRFDGTGNLTLPGNTFAVNYANGTQVSIGGSGNTGNVTFDNQVVIGTGDEYGGGGLYLAPGTNSTANLQYLRVRGGDYPTHIHLDTGNNAYYDQYFGADNKFVKLEANGNVVINTDDSNGNGDTWSFDTTGKFNLPGNLVIAGNANVFGTVSALIQPNDDKPLLAISSGANGAVSSVWVEDIGNIGTSNIAAVYANPIPGSGIVRIAVGQNGGNTGPSLWDFGTDGNLTLPGDSHGITFDTTAETKIQSEMGGIRIYSPDISLVLTEYGNASNVLATWQFSNDGNLTLPDTTTIVAGNGIRLEANSDSNTSGIQVYGDSDANVYAHSNVVIYTDSNGAGNTWTFGTDGNLTIPGGGAVWTLGAGTSGLTANFADPYKVNLGLDYTTNTATLAGANGVVIQSNTGANSNQWTFSADGGLYSPEGSSLGGSLAPNEFALFNNVDTNFSIYTSAANVSHQWTFSADGNLTLPEGGAITNNIPPVTFDILYQYDDLEWDGITVTFTNASSTYMLGVLALMQAGDPITLVGPGGPISTTVSIPYTGGSAGYFTVTEATSPIQITQFTLPNRLTSVNGVTLTTNARNYLFTEAGVTQSPVLTVDTLPSGQYAVAGFRAFVSDANLAPVGNFGEIVGNGGSNTVCVWCDGTNWRIG